LVILWFFMLSSLINNLFDYINKTCVEGVHSASLL
jgi:hypothetical protein